MRRRSVIANKLSPAVRLGMSTAALKGSGDDDNVMTQAPESASQSLRSLPRRPSAVRGRDPAAGGQLRTVRKISDGRRIVAQLSGRYIQLPSLIRERIGGISARK